MDGPAGNTKGGEWPLEGALSERRSPTCAAAPEGQSRPNSELPLRPPLDPPVSARARDRILLSSPENSRPHSLRALPLLSGPSGRTVPKANVAQASSARAEGLAASPALPEALNYLPWARGSSFSAGAARASQVRSRSWRSRPLPLAPRPLIRPRHPPSVTMSELPDPHERCAVQPFRRKLEPGHCLGTGCLEPATWPSPRCVPSRSAPDAAHSRAPSCPALPDSQ